MGTSCTPSKRKSFKECIQNFTWAWHTVLMATGALSSLAVRFHFGLGSEPLKVITLILFFLDIIFFVAITGASILCHLMFPETWKKTLSHPGQGLFVGAFAMGAAGLINTALTTNQNWSFGGRGFLYALWGFWWVDIVISVLTTFILLYAMMTKQSHSMDKMAPVWLLPVVSLIVVSSTGGLIANALRSHSVHLALITTAISICVLLMGLSLALTLVEIYLMRLILHGAPDTSLILSVFTVLGPLGQGGFSLLTNGKDFSDILPLYPAVGFPFNDLGAHIVYGVCICGAWILWAIGMAWIVISLFSVYNVARKNTIPFSLGHWAPIFPNAVFALLTVQLGVVLDSPFFHYMGAIWSIAVLLIWLYAMAMTIPAIWNTTIFSAPYVVPAVPRDVELNLPDPEPGLSTPSVRSPSVSSQHDSEIITLTA